jgi:hypothetical protein
MDSSVSQSPSLRRDRSYRKPVPEYIPSPPASPIVATPDLPKVQAPMPEHEGGEFPPPVCYLCLALANCLPGFEHSQLPEDWQEIMRHALRAQGKRTDRTQDAQHAYLTQETEVDAPQVGPLSDDAVTFSRHPSFFQSTLSVSLDEKTPSVPSSPNGTKRRLPQNYRPPTPPINSASKKRKLTEDCSHEFLEVPRVGPSTKRVKSTENHPPITRSATAAGSSRTSFHLLSTQASFRTEQTGASDAPTFIAGSARTYSHSDVHREESHYSHHEDDWRNLPVLPMFIVKPPPRRRGSALTGSTKVGSMRSHKTWSESCRFTLGKVGSFLGAIFCCFQRSTQD